MSKYKKSKEHKTSRQNKRIRAGDSIKVISGNYRGQTGTVLRRSEDRVVVQGLNMKKKHVKKSQTNPSGEILSIEAPFHISNVMLCVAEDRAVKLRAKQEGGEKIFFYKDDGEQVTYRSADKPH